MAIQLYEAQIGLPGQGSNVRLDPRLAGTSMLTMVGEALGDVAAGANDAAARGWERRNASWISEQRAAISRDVTAHRLEAERTAPEGAPNFVPQQDEWFTGFREARLAEAQAAVDAGLIDSDGLAMLGSTLDVVGVQQFEWAAGVQASAEEAQLGVRLDRTLLSHLEAVQMDPGRLQAEMALWDAELSAAAATWLTPAQETQLRADAERQFTERHYLGWVEQDPAGFLAAYTRPGEPVVSTGAGGAATAGAAADGAVAAAGAAPATPGQRPGDHGAAVYQRAVDLFGHGAVGTAVAAGGGMPGIDGLDPIEFVRELARVLEESDVTGAEAGLTELRDLANAEPPTASPTAPVAIAGTEGEAAVVGSGAAAAPPAPITIPGRPVRLVVPGVSPSFAAALFNQAEGAVRDGQAAAQAAVAQRVHEEELALELGVAVPDPVTPAEIAGAYASNPVRANELIAGLDFTRAVYAERDGMANLSNLQVEALIAGEREALRAGGTAGIEARAGRLRVLEDAATSLLAARREDPAGWALAHSPALRTAFETALGPQGTPSQLQQAIRLSMDRQAEFVDRPGDAMPLPAPMAAQLLTNYGQMTDPRQRLAYLSAVTTGLGDEATAVAVFDQLETAGLDRGARLVLNAGGLTEIARADLLGMLADKAALDERWTQLVPEGRRTELLREGGAVYDLARGAVWDGRAALLGADPTTRALQAGERETALAIGRALAMRAGGGEEPDLEAGVEQALALLFSAEAEIDAGLGFAVVPAADADGIADGMIALREGLAGVVPAADLVRYSGLPAGMVGEAQAADVYAELRGEARWVNQGDGFAIVMPVSGGVTGRLLSDATGAPLIWTAEQLAQVGAAITARSSADLMRAGVPLGVTADDMAALLRQLALPTTAAGMRPGPVGAP